jgi:hypothetical protein
VRAPLADPKVLRQLCLAQRASAGCACDRRPQPRASHALAVGREHAAILQRARRRKFATGALFDDGVNDALHVRILSPLIGLGPSNGNVLGAQ